MRRARSNEIGWKLARCVSLAVALGIFASVAIDAQVSPQRAVAVTAIGTWRGTSLCLVRPSPCNDEVVVYRIALAHGVDSMTIDARKIVRGVEEEMGVLACQYARADAALSCSIPRATWRFRVRGDSLVGELILADGSKFRDVRAARASSQE